MFLRKLAKLLAASKQLMCTLQQETLNSVHANHRYRFHAICSLNVNAWQTDFHRPKPRGSTAHKMENANRKCKCCCVANCKGVSGRTAPGMNWVWVCSLQRVVSKTEHSYLSWCKNMMVWLSLRIWPVPPADTPGHEDLTHWVVIQDESLLFAMQ